MSATPQHSQTDTCAYRDCTETFGIYDAVDGSYCSERCSHRAKGDGLLRDLRQNHVICASCFRLKKEIERPPETYLVRHFREMGHGWAPNDDGTWELTFYSQDISREAVVGFEDHTEHARMGPYGLECVCGAVGHGTDSQTLRETEAWEWWLALASEYLRDIGRREDAVSPATVAHAYYETNYDLEYAVGLALDV